MKATEECCANCAHAHETDIQVSNNMVSALWECDVWKKCLAQESAEERCCDWWIRRKGVAEWPE